MTGQLTFYLKFGEKLANCYSWRCFPERNRPPRRRSKILNVKSIIGFLISLVSVLGINFIPLEIWLYRSFSGETTMIIYWVESLLALLLGVGFVRLFAPPRDETGKLRTRGQVLQLYLLLGLVFGLGGGFFMCVFIFLVLKAKVAFAAVWTAIIWIFGFQILEFIGALLMLRPLTLLKAQLFLNRSLGRIFLLYLCVFVGIGIAFFVEKWFILPFIILKTIVDIGEQIQLFTGSGKRDEKVNPLLVDYSKR